MRRPASWMLLAALSLTSCRLKQQPGAVQPSVDETKSELEAAQAGQRAGSGHFYVQGSKLFDRCGQQVTLRGVSKMVIWTDRQGDSFPEIAKTGANTVRIVWTAKDHRDIAELDQVISRAINTHLIPIIELHDATGDLGRLPQVVDFWLRPEVLGVLKQYEPFLLLNIANEAGGSGVDVATFAAAYTEAITRLRAAGLTLPLMIDAPRWGQDIDVLQAAAPKLLQADPERNLLFSAHLWWPSGEGSDDPGSTKRITTELEESAALGLPLVVGEFAHAGVGCARSIDYKTILAETDKLGIGWLAWSWGPGNKDCKEMDMTRDGRFETLQGWGLEVAVTDPHSIQKTSRIPESVLRPECPSKVLK